jgi:hypothetical protein
MDQKRKQVLNPFFGGRPPDSGQVDTRGVTVRVPELDIACEERRIQRFGERYICGVIRRQRLPQFPYSRQPIEVRITM